MGCSSGGWFTAELKTQHRISYKSPVLKNKWYFDEIYNFLFVKPAYWVAEQFTCLFMDRKIIDGFLHSVARFSLFLGHFFRNKIDLPVINQFVGDGTGNVVKASGSDLRKIQAGRIQYYMVASLAVLCHFCPVIFLPDWRNVVATVAVERLSASRYYMEQLMQFINQHILDTHPVLPCPDGSGCPVPAQG